MFLFQIIWVYGPKHSSIQLYVTSMDAKKIKIYFLVLFWNNRLRILRFVLEEEKNSQHFIKNASMLALFICSTRYKCTLYFMIVSKMTKKCEK